MMSCFEGAAEKYILLLNKAVIPLLYLQQREGLRLKYDNPNCRENQFIRSLLRKNSVLVILKPLASCKKKEKGKLCINHVFIFNLMKCTMVW